MGRRKSHPGFADAPGVSITSSPAASAALSSGAFCQYLSGPAAVATAGEEIAAAHADGKPQRDSMRIGRIAQFRIKKVVTNRRLFVSIWSIYMDITIPHQGTI